MNHKWPSSLSMIGQGYTYAMFFLDGNLKIGSTTFPTNRFREHRSYLGDQDAVIFTTERTHKFSANEKAMIAVLKPLRTGNSYEWLKWDQGLFLAVLNCFKNNFRRESVMRLCFMARISSLCHPADCNWPTGAKCPPAYEVSLREKRERWEDEQAADRCIIN